MKGFRLIIVPVICLSAVLFYNSCLSQAMPDEVSSVSVDKAYVFGRFRMDYRRGGETVYLLCVSADNEREHLFPFNSRDELVVKEVLPGKYQIAGFRIVSGNKIAETGFFNDRNQAMMDVFSVKAGEAVYLGDFLLQASVQDVRAIRPETLKLLIQNKIDIARYHIRRRYPGFELIFTRDLMNG